MQKTYALPLLILLLAGCTNDAPPSVSTPSTVAPSSSAPAPPLEEADLGAAQPAHKAGHVYLAGQPAATDLGQWREQGIKTVVSLRNADEIDWDEKTAVEEAGMRFLSLPFQGADELSDELLDSVRNILGDAEQQPVAVHCGAANRVGAVWMAYRTLDQGVSPQRAEEEAREAGLSTDALAEKVLDYVKRRQESGEAPTQQ